VSKQPESATTAAAEVRTVVDVVRVDLPCETCGELYATSHSWVGAVTKFYLRCPQGHERTSWVEYPRHVYVERNAT
jgi:Zn finger protein HypA/HybF involved in hydrogenase expression